MSVDLKYSLVLTRIFRFKTASLFVERYRSVVCCSFSIEDLISRNFYKCNN
jgi:hypothetical protein